MSGSRKKADGKFSSETVPQERRIHFLTGKYSLLTNKMVRLTLKDVVWSQADRMDVAVKTLGLCSALREGRNANGSWGHTPVSTFACDSHVFAKLKFCF